MTDLAFNLDVAEPGNRRIEVWVECPVSPDSRTFVFPSWTPGSYLMREYARHVRGLQAEDADTGSTLSIQQLGKNEFVVQVDRPTTARLRYSVYAHELTVRTSDVGPGHAYWNGACVYLWPTHLRSESARVSVQIPDGWQLVTQIASEPSEGNRHQLAPATLDELVDAPCLCAPDLEFVEFEVAGVPHRYVFHGLGPVRPPTAIVEDTIRVIEAAATIFGGGLPYERYDFLSLHAESGGGGLEHTDSSTLLAPRTSLRPGKTYRGFMGLVAHEHFHVWNVKRMRPADLWTFDYGQELYTELLWVAEGFTAYFDDHLCLRAGIHDASSYLAVVAQNLTALDSNEGRFHLSLSRSSFDAWVRLYRPDEDSRNSSQNYYTNGALAALILDLTIRSLTDGDRSLDDVMRWLWENTWLQERGYTRKDVEAALEHAAGSSLDGLLAELVDGPFDPDFTSLLKTHGVVLEREGCQTPRLGVAFRKDSTVVANVVDGSPAWHADLCPDDELLAISGLRLRGGNWEKVMETGVRVGEPTEILLSRRGVIVRTELTPDSKPGNVRLKLDEAADDATLARRRGWLGA